MARPLAGHVYEAWISQLRTVSAKSLSKIPKRSNLHWFKAHPFAGSNGTNPLQLAAPTGEPLPSPRVFRAARRQRAVTLDSTFPALAAPTDGAVPRESGFLRDIPLPAVLARHVQTPHATLLRPSFQARGPSPLAPNAVPTPKVSGFKIVVWGRKGNMTFKQATGYGRVGVGSYGSSYVDFGRSRYTHSKGASGIKVWVGYDK